MLKVTDYGCCEHTPQILAVSGLEAELMENLLHNLPSEEAFHTFICAHGHTHRLTFLTVRLAEDYGRMVQNRG